MKVFLYVLALAMFFIGIYVGGSAQEAKPKQEQKVDGHPAPLQQRPEPPKEGTVYVWPLPISGHQSVVTLGIVDGETVDAAFLVPVRVRVKGIKAPDPMSRSGKDAMAALEKAIAGQLHTVQLWGNDPQGGVLADFWLPGDKEAKGQWLSEHLVKEGLVKAAK